MSRKTVLSLSLVAIVGTFACSSNESSDDEDTGAIETASLSDGHVCTDPLNLNAPLPCPASKGIPDSTIEPALLDNGGLFTSPFFGRHSVHHRGAAPGDETGGLPLKLTDQISKNYYFPTRYRDVTTAVAMFLCDWKKAKALMPHPEMDPVDMGLGRSLVVITSYRYNRVFGIKPYNEVAIAIPTVSGKLINPPLLPLLLKDWFDVGFYVLSMPVTTVENNIRGHELWGLPKAVQEIDLTVKGDDYVTSVKDEGGATYLEFKVPMNGDAMHVDSRTYIYSTRSGVTYRAPSHTLGDFTTTKWITTLDRPLSMLKRDTSGGYLTLGDSPAASALKELEIAPRPFQVRFSKATESVFDLPDAQLDEGGDAVAPASYGPR